MNLKKYLKRILIISMIASIMLTSSNMQNIAYAEGETNASKEEGNTESTEEEQSEDGSTEETTEETNSTEDLTTEEASTEETTTEETEIIVEPVSIENAVISLPGTSYEYNGTAVTPVPTVICDGITLTNNVDYTVSYLNNNAIGTATCIVTGQENYTGSISVTFELTLKQAKITSLETSYNKITIKWEKTPGADKFVIYRSDDAEGDFEEIAMVEASEKAVYKDKDVAIGEKYFYKVLAYSGDVFTESKVKSKCVKPSQAVITKAVSKSYNTIKIKWDKVKGASGYIIYRSDSLDGGYKKIATVKKDKFIYKDEGVTTGVTYYYKVKAYRTADGETYNGAKSAASAVAAIPSKTTIAKYTSDSGSVKLEWLEIEGANGYIIYRSTSKTGKYTKVAKVSKKTTTYEDTYLAGGETYYYKIRAFRKVDGVKVFSKYSKAVGIDVLYSRSAVVNQARLWLGIKEKSTGHKQILKIYNSYKPRARNYKMTTSDAWCAAFVSAVAIKIGYTDIIPIECSCRMLIELLQEMGCWEEDDSYVPKPGDIIFYDWNDTTGNKSDNTGDPEHVGIVEKVEGNKITVIEGNYKNAVTRRVVKINGKYIRGYGLPNYESD